MPEGRLLRVLGTALRRRRELRGLTQQALADATGTSQATIARIERGTRAPSVVMLEMLFAALGAQLAVTVEPLDADVDAQIAELTERSIAERIAETRLDRAIDSLGGIPYVLAGCTAAILQNAPVPADAIDLAVAWRDAEAFTDWLTDKYAQRWNAKWQQFGYLALDPREPGDHRWQTMVGEIRAMMCDELPEVIEVRHNGRPYRVVPLAQVEVMDPHAANLLRRYRESQAGAAELAG